MSKHLVLNKISDAEAAYLAGIVDGEGSVTLIRNNSDRKYTTRHRAHVIITNTHLEMLTWVAQTVGAGTIRSRRISGVGKKPCYVWVLGSRVAAELLDRLVPFMIIKRRKAELVVKLYRDGKWQGWGKKYRVSDSELERRQAVYHEFKAVGGVQQ